MSPENPMNRIYVSTKFINIAFSLCIEFGEKVMYYKKQNKNAKNEPTALTFM